MNSADRALQIQGAEHYHETGNFIISGIVAPMMEGFSTISINWHWNEVAGGCISLGIFAFLNYLPYSKHLHILLAFPNAYYARLDVMGKMDNMESVQNEVKYMMQPELAPTRTNAAPMKFGAKDVFDLSWKSFTGCL